MTTASPFPSSIAGVSENPSMMLQILRHLHPPHRRLRAPPGCGVFGCTSATAPHSSSTTTRSMPHARTSGGCSGDASSTPLEAAGTLDLRAGRAPAVAACPRSTRTTSSGGGGAPSPRADDVPRRWSREAELDLVAELYTDKDAACRWCRYSAREQVLAEVHKLVGLYHGRGEEVSVTETGHSLGSALATLGAFDIAETGANVSPDGRTAPVCVFSFSGPRVGNTQFKARLERELGVKVFHVVNMHDMVPTVPGVFYVLDERSFPEAALRLMDDLGLGRSDGDWRLEGSSSSRLCALQLHPPLPLVVSQSPGGTSYMLRFTCF